MTKNRAILVVVAACTLAASAGCAASRNTGEGAGNLVRSAGDKVEDSTITFNVKTALIRDKVVDAGDINVDTDDGIVTLTGAVPTEQARVRALTLARQASGVRGVVDRITVAP
jgi:hyperosmotically inducible protein